jgi:hypothetical protein
VWSYLAGGGCVPWRHGPAWWSSGLCVTVCGDEAGSVRALPGRQRGRAGASRVRAVVRACV